MWAAREADAQHRWDTHVAPHIIRLDQEIARHTATLEGTADRLERRTTAANAVISHAFQRQGDADKLADRLQTHRDHIRREATRRQQQLQIVPARTPNHRRRIESARNCRARS